MRTSKLFSTLAASAVLFSAATVANAQSAASTRDYDLFSDTWVATDALGRKLPVGSEVRAPRKDKTVAVFYFLWHGLHGTPGPLDISKMLAANPKNPAWGPVGAFHWWGEPEAGYFRSDDPWIARRNLSMLSDAGVDTIFIDVTNAATYPAESKVLFDAMRQMRNAGLHTPQFAYILHSHEVPTVQTLWDFIYKNREYSELYFKWQGKPLILADINASEGGKTIPQNIRDAFTWRYSWAWDAGAGKWPWIEKYPQNPGYETDPTKPEELAVSVASHPINNIGRSYSENSEPPHNELGLTDFWPLGIQFAEQWKRALEVDPQLVFVDGWNEWVAQRFVVDGASGPEFLGKPTVKGDTFFVDTFNAEYSRDIAPMKGGSTDNYYYQLVANIRRFKGARRQPNASTRRAISLDGKDDDWKNVQPEYRDTIGDTLHRDHAGWGVLHYVNTSGRNDIIRAKVARDDKNVYFLAQTQDKLSPISSKNWMWLFIDSDQNAATGWNGYDFAINGDPQNENATPLRRAVLKNGVWTWEKIDTVSYRAVGNTLEIAVPRSRLGQTKTLNFDFHFADNADPVQGISQFFTQGDSAPNRRFNYRYSAPN